MEYAGKTVWHFSLTLVILQISKFRVASEEIVYAIPYFYARTNDAFKYGAIASPKILLISLIFSIFLSTIAY